MEEERAGATAQETRQADILILDAAYKAPDASNTVGRSGGRGWKRALEVALWAVLIGGFMLVIREHVHSAEAARAAGTANPGLSFMNSVAQMLVTAIVSVRLARRWMEDGTLVSRMQVRGRIIEMTPKWNQGMEYVSTNSLESVVVKEPAFGNGSPRMTLTDKDKRRHTMIRVSNASDLGAFAEVCRSAGISYEQKRTPRIKAALYFGACTVLTLILLLTLDPQHPVECMVEMAGLGLVVLLLGLMNRNRW